MRFSILLPTRNRPDLLNLAVESVLLQEFADWEIIISDNASDPPVRVALGVQQDSRIRIRRFAETVPVTVNWNAALESASGEYLIMLGDDDVLMPDALAKASTLIEQWNYPDTIYAQAHQYAYANVVPGHTQPFVQTGYNAFLEGVRQPFRLDKRRAEDMAKAAMGFRILFGFNMQHFVFSRNLVEHLKAKGPFFQSPYPDYYAANAIFLGARSIVATPDPICLIGISPKSFGFFYVNAKEAEGVAFLNNTSPEIAVRLRDEFVPGTNMNDSWLCAMATLQRNFPEVKAEVDYSRYRRLQYHATFSAGAPGRLVSLLRTMRIWELGAYGVAAMAYLLVGALPAGTRRRLRDSISHALFSRSPRFDPRREAVPYKDILEAARANAR